MWRALLALLGLLVLAAPLPTADAGAVLEGCVAIDGDTLRCGRIGIRLTGYDAWEICEPLGPDARDALAALLDDGINLHFVGRDRYGRVLARATRAGTDVAALMRRFWRPRQMPRPQCP